MGSITRPPPDMSSNGLAPQSQDVTYRSQSRRATPVIENARVVMRQVQEYCQENKTRRKQGWESHRTTLQGLRKHKEQQKQHQSQEEWDASYAQMLQDFEQT